MKLLTKPERRRLVARRGHFGGLFLCEFSHPYTEARKESLRRHEPDPWAAVTPFFDLPTEEDEEGFSIVSATVAAEISGKSKSYLALLLKKNGVKPFWVSTSAYMHQKYYRTCCVLEVLLQEVMLSGFRQRSFAVQMLKTCGPSDHPGYRTAAVRL